MLSLIKRPLIYSFVRAASSSTFKHPVELKALEGTSKWQSFSLFTPVVQTQYAAIHSSPHRSSAGSHVQGFDGLGGQHLQSLNSPFMNSILLASSNRFTPTLTPCRFLMAFRRKKMNKHKRKKRFDRDYFKYQKYHIKKKAKAENIFRQQMNAMMNELKTFDPLENIKTTIETAKQEWSTSVASSGRKKYPYWHELMTLEELYGLKLDHHIDKKAGRPSEEDEAKLKQMRAEYFKSYTRND